MSIQSPSLAANVDHQRVWDLGYELLELSRSETYCDTWRIRHRESYELFAWKQLRTEWETDPRARSGLENEAAVGRMVGSPLLLRLISAHLAERPRYLIWEWFEALTLEQLFREYGRLPLSPALWIVRQCAEGLNALLQAGLTHGDIRPDNILVEPLSGLVKLTELGSSRRVAPGTGMETGRRAASPGPITDFDSVASPAHLQREARDLYSLGLILYQALAGRSPFEAETPAEMIRGRDVNLADELRKFRPDVPPALAELVRDLLATQASRPIRHPSVLIQRLMEFEISALTKLDPQWAR